MRKATISGLVLAVTALLAPASALAEGIVPPGNSAATQYTEAFPTPAGEKDSGDKKKPDRTPDKVLGPRKARQLEEQGSAGKAVADFTAETSPDPVAASAGKGDGQSAKKKGKKKSQSGDTNNGGNEGSGVAAGNGSGSGPGSGSTLVSDSGSSGFGQVLGQATGTTDSGKLGLLLPLILVGAAIWAFAFYWRNRQKQRVA